MEDEVWGLQLNFTARILEDLFLLLSILISFDIILHHVEQLSCLGGQRVSRLSFRAIQKQIFITTFVHLDISFNEI